jgi:hypothetical protein
LQQKEKEKQKKIRAQQKMVVQKEDWESSLQSSYDKKKNEKAHPKSSTVTMMNDSMGWKKQETLNLKPKYYMDWDSTKKVKPKVGILAFTKLIIPWF